MNLQVALESVEQKKREEILQSLTEPPKVKKVQTYKFVQEKVRRGLKKEDHYYIWRRYENGVETWLCVIWHKNWRNRLGSDVGANSYLREDVEKWVINSLRRIHYSFEDLKVVHDDFETLANHPAFEIKTKIIPKFKLF